uniref:Reverse transcriptase domain-containing protein n=1 Tax=Tanacetum cinerariifolium TaxID=118510 RepID=A0A6L2NK67_TANCI|nr:reverse transcriptase domain-containing protein [Tanacetum cinerariifolium]
MNGDDSHNSGTGVRRTERATHECTYTDFLKCQPLPFKGTEGVASLSQWCERMESIFHISNCAVENQVKFATCTLHSVALTWWNTHVKTVGHEAAYGMPWKTLMKMMTDKYCPRNEIMKLEMEMWDRKVKGTDLASYTQRFQELALLCGRMFFEESDKIKKYIGGLPDMIHGSVVASKPKTMQEAVEIATELMDKKICTFAERETASKRKFENTSRNTQNQQQQSNKRPNTGRVYTAASGEKKQYGGSKPLCAKCNYHHDGPCAPKCRNCNKIGHFARDCRSTANTNNANNQRGTGSGQKTICYECGVQGNFKRECPKLKNNNNHGNQGGRNNAPARVYAVGRAETDPEVNVVTGTFLLNNRYASVLFDTGVDKSFVSTTFNTQINITPSTLDHCYDVELADGRIIGLNTILRDCTLNLLNHPFNINLMPIELGNETLIIHGDSSTQGNATRLSIISCTKTEKYMKKGFPIFLEHITTKEVEDKSEKKRLEDVPIVQNFPEVFPEDLSGLTPTRPMEFQIDLVPGAAPCKTRSSTKELFSPLENPEQIFRSKRRLLNTPSLIESNSPEFNQISDIEEQSKKERIEEINKFQQEPDESLFPAWERFKELLMKCHQHYLTNMQEVILFYNGLDVPTRQIMDSKGAIPSKIAADAKVAIQEMAEFSQKWHNETSSRSRSTETFDGLAVIQVQLNNLRREIKKINEKVYVAQVEYGLYSHRDVSYSAYAMAEGNNKGCSYLQLQIQDNRVPQQPPFKKPDVAMAYIIGANEKKAYAGNLPYYNKYKLHHVGPCTVKCSNCKGVGYMTRDCKASVAAMNQRAHVANPKATITCYECGRLRHFRNECQKLRNQNQVNQIWKEKARGNSIVVKDKTNA